MNWTISFLPRPGRAVSLSLAVVLLSGCNGSTPHVASASGAATRASADAQEKVRQALALLHEGKPDPARKRLVAALAARPDYAAAASLLKQIDMDPRALLGRNAERYTVRQGDTFAEIAQRAMGDPLLFYALARYNGFAQPDALVPGQSIMVPTRQAAKASSAKNRKVKVKPDKANKAPAASSRAQNAARSIAKAKPAADPVKAAKLRASGLMALNNGRAAEAVDLLRSAAAQDPGNGAIQADLARAIRVRGSVGGQ